MLSADMSIYNLKMRKKKILIISASNPTRAYSCLKYMYQSLVDKGYQTTVWCGVPHKQLKDLKAWGDNVHSFQSNILGRIPRERILYYKFCGIIACFRYRNEVIICHDFFFYFICVWIKKIYPATAIIHYCTEIITDKSSWLQRKSHKSYEKNSDVADLMIECDEMRRKYRVKQYKISKPNSVILNTIPYEETLKLKIKKRTGKSEVPIVVYSGAIIKAGQLDILINALSLVEEEYYLKLYCYGQQIAISELREKCQVSIGKNKFTIIEGLSREEVLGEIRYADIGILYYDPEYSINTRYAAPTKFFEYVALGIPAVCSNNESLASLIDEYNLGLRMETNDANGMADCIRKLLRNPDLRQEISRCERNAFKDSLCYEKQSEKAYKLMEALMVGEYQNEYGG